MNLNSDKLIVQGDREQTNKAGEVNMLIQNRIWGGVTMFADVC